MLVNRFIEVEDRNFALFNYVNEQNNQVETLQEKIIEVGGQEIKRVYGQSCIETLHESRNRK